MKRRWRAIALISLLLLASAALLWRASKAECWALVGDIICRVETVENVVALSFDDGPTEQGVTAVLDSLGRHKVRATFFLIGKHMEDNPGQAERLVAAGMEIANHSYSHRKMIGSSEAHYRDEIRRTKALLAAAGGNPNTLFRPPFGRKLIGLPRAVGASGHRIIMWDVADRVGQNPTPSSYANDILARTRPGSIILMHPMYRHNHVERAALPLILDGLKAKGYQIVTVGELLAQHEMASAL